MKQMRRMILTTLAILMAVALLTAPAYSAVEDGKADQTLSPYFFVEGKDDATDRFPLKRTEVTAAISGVMADVTVRQQYANMGGAPIHGKYVFPGSTRAAVHGMRMTIGERVIVAKIKEKDAARQTYEQAKSEGKSASLLEQQRPNVFTMEVANIMPGDAVDIELKYTELLLPTDGVYEFVYPTVVGPRFSDTPAAGAPPGEDWVRNPYLKEGDAPKTTFDISATLSTGIPLQEAVCPSHDTDIAYEGPSLARVGLSDPSDFGGNRDFILRYRLAGGDIQSGLLLYEGKDENFFLLMAEPPERVTPEQMPGREYIFVADVSGSMSGFPLNAAKELLRDLIGGLKPADLFNVVLFAGGSDRMSTRSVPASAANIRQAVRFIDNESGGGGTRLLSAMVDAMSISRPEGFSRSLIVVTDGYISGERKVFDHIREHLNQSNVFAFGIGSSVNRYLIEGVARAGMGEPFVVTDPQEAPAKARAFREYVSAPVLTGISVDYDGFDAYDVEPSALPDMLARRPVILFGKWRGGRTGTIRISGTAGDGPYEQTFNIADTAPLEENRALPYLWARTRIARLSDFNPRPDDPENRSEIVSLGLTYNLLTAFTSFVAVDDVVRNPGGAADEVKQPLPLPVGVPNLAVGGVASVPEPEMALMAGLFAAALLIGWVRRRRIAR